MIIHDHNAIQCHIFWNNSSVLIQGDKNRWTKFRTSIFPELYMVCEWSTQYLKEEVLNFQIPPLERSPSAQPCSSVSWDQNGCYAVMSHVLPWYMWSAGAFSITQTAYLFKLLIPTTNALPRWRMNVETKTKRTLHSSRRLSFNPLNTELNPICYCWHY